MSLLQEQINRLFELIAASKLPAELVEQTSLSAIDYGVVSQGTSDAKKVSMALMRGYLGTYNATTNTPTLSDVTGVEGDSYEVTIGGNQDFGSGVINMLVGDVIEYRNSKWRKSGDSVVFSPTITGATKGDILVYDGVSDWINFGVGTDGQVLSSNSASTYGIAWANAPTLQDLDSVLTIGNISTLTARFGKVEIDSANASLDVIASILNIYNSNNIRIRNTTNDTELYLDYANGIGFRNGGAYYYFKSDNLSTARTYQMPDASGIIPLTVNGYTANSLGEITIPTVAMPLTTKGDIFTYSTVPDRLGVGTDGYILSADSLEPTGLKWISPSAGTSPLTTKGDLFGYTTGDARIPVGTDGQALFADSAQASGLIWRGIVEADITDLQSYYLASNPSGYISGNQSITLSGDVSGTGTTAITTTVQPTLISGKALVTPVATDMVLIWDATDSSLKRVDASNFLGSGSQTLQQVLDTGNTSTTSANFTSNSGVTFNTDSSITYQATVLEVRGRTQTDIITDNGVGNFSLIRGTINDIRLNTEDGDLNKEVRLFTNLLSVQRNISFPDASGTIALTTDIPTQLSDLTDVVSATNTNRFVLVANGTTGYVGRALVEADISDFGTYLTSYTETQTLQDVTDLGSTTTTTITSNSGATLGGNRIQAISNDGAVSSLGFAVDGGTENVGALFLKNASSGEAIVQMNTTQTNSAFYVIPDKAFGSYTFAMTSDLSGFLTGNETITLSGDVTGSGATSISSTVVALRGKGINVAAATPSDGDILVYRTATGTWDLETKPVPGGGGATQLSELSDVTSATQTAGFVLASSGGNYLGRALISSDIPNLSLTKITDVTATSGELNLLDLSGLTVGWVLSADSATTASWKAPTGGTYTASNGLTMTANNVKLGGALTENTTISGNFNINLTGSVSSSFGLLSLSNSGTGAGIFIEKTSTTSTSSLISLDQYSTSYYAEPILARRLSTTLNGQLPFMRFIMSPTTPANGDGSVIKMDAGTIGGSNEEQTQFGSYWENATAGAGLSAGFRIYLTINNTLQQEVFRLRGDKGLTLPGYGINTFSNTPAYALGVDASGNVIEFTPSAGGGDDVSTFPEKTGNLVGTDRLVGLSGATDFSETISGIPLSIFNNDAGWTSNTGDMVLASTQTNSGAKTFLNNTFLVRNPANTFSYTLVSGAITAARTMTLPALTANDTFVFLAQTQTLTNKTLTSPTLTTPTINTSIAGTVTSGGNITTTNYLVGATATQTLTNKTITFAGNTLTDVMSLTTAQSVTAGIKKTFQANATNAGFRLAGVTANPSTLVAGDIWYRTDTEELNYRGTSVVRTLVNLTGTQALTNKSINGVTLATGGSASLFLNQQGNYVSAGTSVSFGTTTQIPYMNVGGTDFLYSSAFVYASTGRVDLGVASTTQGSLFLYGDNLGTGGRIRLYNGATGQTNDNSYYIRPNDGIFEMFGVSTGTFFSYNSSNSNMQIGVTAVTSTISMIGNVTATSFNGVALTTGGSATQYLDGTGNYSTPTGGGIGGSIADNQIAVGATTANNIEGQASLTYDVSTFTQAIGVNDTSAGSLWLYGNSTTTSGELRIYNGASDDTTLDYWRVHNTSGAFRVEADAGSPKIIMSSSFAQIINASSTFNVGVGATSVTMSEASGNPMYNGSGNATTNTLNILMGDVDGVGNSFLVALDQANSRLNIISGVLSIGGTQVLSGTALGSSVVSSSLTSVGTITSGTWNSTIQIGGVTVTASASELNLLDLSGLTAGWVLSADSATTASWKAQSVNGQTVVVGDHGTASTDEVVNVCYGTSATPPSAATVTEGALYIQYTA